MTRQPLRVAFAGLAHSHPAADAANVTVSGGRVVAVFDEDARAAADFAERFGGVATLSLGALAAESPDLIIATPRPDEAARVVRALAAIDARGPDLTVLVCDPSMRDHYARVGFHPFAGTTWMEQHGARVVLDLEPTMIRPGRLPAPLDGDLDLRGAPW